MKAGERAEVDGGATGGASVVAGERVKTDVGRGVATGERVAVRGAGVAVGKRVGDGVVTGEGVAADGGDSVAPGDGPGVASSSVVAPKTHKYEMRENRQFIVFVCLEGGKQVYIVYYVRRTWKPINVLDWHASIHWQALYRTCVGVFIGWLVLARVPPGVFILDITVFTTIRGRRGAYMHTQHTCCKWWKKVTTVVTPQQLSGMRSLCALRTVCVVVIEKNLLTRKCMT